MEELNLMEGLNVNFEELEHMDLEESLVILIMKMILKRLVQQSMVLSMD